MSETHNRKYTRRDALRGVGIGAATMGLSGCVTRASRYIGDEGGERVMNIASAYAIEAPVATMQKVFASIVEEETNNEITTRLYPAGQLSAGSKLASKVQGGSIEVGSVSLSNFSPYAPAVDLVNLPYFASEFQEFVNLITSDIWEQKVYDNVRENGFEPLFIWMGAPRELGLRKQINDPIMRPQESRGVKIRIPSSGLSSRAWTLAGANPTPVGWGGTAQAAEEGVIDAVHVSLPPLAAYGFEDLLGHITSVKMFMDSGIFAMSKGWFDGLPQHLQDGIKTAAEKTFRRHLEVVVPTLRKARRIMKSGGVTLHDLNDKQLQTWEKTVGYQLPVWNKTKKRLAGDMRTFERFEQAVDKKHGYTVKGV